MITVGENKINLSVLKQHLIEKNIEYGCITTSSKEISITFSRKYDAMVAKSLILRLFKEKEVNIITYNLNAPESITYDESFGDIIIYKVIIR